MLEELEKIDISNIDNDDIRNLMEKMDKSISFDSNVNLDVHKNNSFDSNSNFYTNEEAQENNELDNCLTNLVKHFLKFNTSFVELCAMAEMLNKVPGITIKIPESKPKLLKQIRKQSKFNYYFYIFCESCKTYIQNNYQQLTCTKCLNNSLSQKYFLYIELEHQLKHLIDRNWEQIDIYNKSISVNNLNIRDVHDGLIFKKNSKEKIISLMLCTDGVVLQKNSSKSCWPIQLICNLLPPHKRFNSNNIIITSLYYDESKPDYLELFKPLCEEIERINETGIHINNTVFKIYVTHGVFDLVAKAPILNMVQYNGRYGCGYCYHPGESLNRLIRYTQLNYKPEYRTHGEVTAAMEKILQNGNNGSRKNQYIKGVKGISPLIGFKYFDTVNSVAIDYMHNSLLGVLQTVIGLWFTPNKDKSYYLSDNKRKELNKRIVSVKLSYIVTRKPRSLKYMSQFKASEYRSMLLYYIVPCLEGILPSRFLKHLQLLCSSIYTLLGDNISESDLNNAAMKLDTFVQEFEILYDRKNVTMNIHLLSHISNCVKNLGPLWSFSMFAFESNNGMLKKYFNGTTDVIEQIAMRYILKQSMCISNIKTNKEKKAQSILGPRREIVLSPSQIIAIDELSIELKNNVLMTYMRFKKRDQIYTCFNYKKPKNTIDYYVELRNGAPAKVDFYFIYKGIKYAMIDVYGEVTKIDQFKQIILLHKKKVISVEEIEKKYNFIQVNLKEYVVLPPNGFEKD